MRCSSVFDIIQQKQQNTKTKKIRCICFDINGARIIEIEGKQNAREWRYKEKEKEKEKEKVSCCMHFLFCFVFVLFVLYCIVEYLTDR